MKKLFKILSLIVVVSLCSCGGSTSSEDSSLAPEEQQAVSYVKSHLEKGVKFLDYEVVQEEMPVEVLEQQFQQFRNGVFKAGLDYQSCKTRNIEAGMEMNVNKLAIFQEEIQHKVMELRNAMSGKKVIIVFGKVKTKATEEVAPQSLVVAIDPQTMEQIAWIPVTVPVQNNVGMIISAMRGRLFDYALTQNHDFKEMAAGENDPVIKFILESRAV